MLFPYNTDAPIYHFPISTIGLIVVNSFLFFGTVWNVTTEAEFESLKWLCLEFDQLDPFQWLMNNFMHADIMHLIGNMVFLWAFGLVVEGKLGWWKYLAVFVGIGIVSSAFTQIVMFTLFRSPQFALGASGIIYGVMGMALVWAPKNNLQCLLWMGVFSRLVELPVMAFSGIYIGLQIVFFVCGGFQMSSEALHLTGLAVGLPVGVLLLRRGMVDCEGWDLFNVLRGTEEDAAREALDKRRRERRGEDDDEGSETVSTEDRLVEARNLLRRAITEKQHVIVVTLYKKYHMLFESGIKLSGEELTGLVQAMHQSEMFDESIPLMRMAIDRVPRHASQLRVNLAQILLQKSERPRQAIAVLRKLPPALPPELEKRKQQILQHAQKQIADGSLEVDTEE